MSLTSVKNDELVRREFACKFLPERLKVRGTRDDVAVAAKCHELPVRVMNIASLTYYLPKLCGSSTA